jgi:protein-L-isoaspartate(D-aspartate) O-methyltransferase
MVASLRKDERAAWLADLAARGRRGERVEAELREVARACRTDLVASIDKEHGPFAAHLLRALVEVPREKFVRDDDVAKSADDTPLSLDDEGLATISAPHAYLLSFRLLELERGDSLLELGSGSGYGAALASDIVGSQGLVTTVEIDEALARRASTLLARIPNVRVLHGDAAHLSRTESDAEKIVVTFAVDRIPDAWLAMLDDGARLVAPVGARGDQRLVRVVRRGRELMTSDHGAVRYVRNRSPR